MKKIKIVTQGSVKYFKKTKKLTYFVNRGLWGIFQGPKAMLLDLKLVFTENQPNPGLESNLALAEGQRRNSCT